MGGHALVAAGDEHRPVEGGRAGVYLDHVGDHIPGGQGVVDAVVALGLAVADVCGDVPGAGAPRVPDAPADLLCQLQQVHTAGVAVAEGALDHDLGLGQVLRRPAGAQPQRVQLRRDLPELLALRFVHGCPLLFLLLRMIIVHFPPRRKDKLPAGRYGCGGGNFVHIVKNTPAKNTPAEMTPQR